GYYMPRSSEGEAKALLNNVVEAVKENSQQTFERINKLDAEYLRDDLYAFVVDRETQRFIANGYNLSLFGGDFRYLHSADRYPIGNQILEAAAQSGCGCISYLWPDAVTRKNEPDVTLFEASDSCIVAVGYYLDEEQ